MRDFTVHPRLRVAALVMSGAAAAIRGVAYIDAPTSGFTTFVDTWIPLHYWAFVWIGAGVIMVAGIWHSVVARWGLSLGVGLWGAWSISFTASWLFGDQSRGWVTASAFALVAGLTWIVAQLADSVGPPPGPVIPDRPEDRT